MPTFKLNGQDADFEPGEMVIEAAARNGVSIPYYCYHPDLTRPANCRMCLVELVGAPKLIPSCQWPVNEKMEINTEGDRVERAQQDVQEFLLINHPLDCPICDQAGECKLQQYAYLFGPPASAMEEPKVKLEKRKVLGPNVVLDQERCISCTRCVRFCEEVTDTRELNMVNRGHFQTVDRHADRELDNDYSGCVVDMCPVGALTDRHFRFQARVWYVQPVSSTCTLCSRGCNVQVDRRGERGQRPEIKRTRGRRNPAVNKSWICDEGRYGYQRVGEGERPLRAAGGDARSAEAPFGALEAALSRAGELLQPREGAKGWLGVLASGAETNEELAAFATLARSADPDAALAVPAHDDADEDGILRRTDKSANRNGARRVGFGDDVAALAKREVVVVLDADLRPGAGLAADVVKKAKGDGELVALVAHERAWLGEATVSLPLANGFEKEGTIVNCDGVVQRIARAVPPPGDCRDGVRHASDLAREAGLAAMPRESADWLGKLAEHGFPAGLEALTTWGARLGDDGGFEPVEEPVQLFSSAPKSFGEGEYGEFLQGAIPPPALHVAAGLPPRLHDGRPWLSRRDEADDSGTGPDTGEGA